MPVTVSPDNIQITPLQSQIFASGASVSIQTAGAIPTGRQVRRVIFLLDVDVTQPGAGMAAQFGNALFALISQIKMGRLVSITGFGLHIMNWMMRGMVSESPAGWAAGSASDVRSRHIMWTLDWLDVTASRPTDACIPSELFTDPIEVRFNTNAIFAATVPTLGNGLLRTYVEHEAASVAKNGKTAVVPPTVNIQSDDFNALTALINKPGLWLYAYLYREVTPNDLGIITTANVSNVIVGVDGIPLMNNVRGLDIASIWNGARAEAPNPEWEGQVDSVPGVTTAATAPSHLPGSAINTQFGDAAGAGQSATMNFLPLLFPALNYKLSQVPRANIGMKVDLTGTLGAYKIGYRIHERRPDSEVGNAARRLGVTNGKFAAKTGNKSLAQDPSLAPFLPASIAES